MSGRNRGRNQPPENQEHSPAADTSSPSTESATDVDVNAGEEETVAPENKVEETTDPVVEESAETKAEETSNVKEDNSKTITVGTASSQILSTTATDVDVNAGLTKIRISYPEDFKGKKFFDQDEEKFVSKEVADQFVELGIASIVE